jgi:hypothetical protein
MEFGRRSAGEWLFQLTTITIGVLIALSFDAVLRWNADRTLVREARATVALELAENRTELEPYLASFDERMANLDNVLKLLEELDAGIEPTVREVVLGVNFPTLNDAGWQTAERTGSLALMNYPEVQALAEVYALQALFSDTLKPAFLVSMHGASLLNATGNPYTMAPAVREAMRARILELRAHFALAQQFGSQLSEGYSKLEQ